MAFINNSYDVTIAPGPGPIPAYLSAAANRTGMNFEEAMNANRIYQNNGLICQRRMCNSMTGCDSALACQTHPDYKNIVQFCGGIGTPAKTMRGSEWRLVPENEMQVLTASTERRIGMSQLPTPFNTVGMY